MIVPILDWKVRFLLISFSRHLWNKIEGGLDAFSPPAHNTYVVNILLVTVATKWWTVLSLPYTTADWIYKMSAVHILLQVLWHDQIWALFHLDYFVDTSNEINFYNNKTNCLRPLKFNWHKLCIFPVEESLISVITPYVVYTE